MNVVKTIVLSLTIAMVTSGATVAYPIVGNSAIISVPESLNTETRDLGRAPATYPVSIVVTLPYRNDQQLEQLIRAQGDPSSASYHHYLTPGQFAAMFGPTPRDEATVMLILQRAGFRIAQRSSNRTLIDATAPAAAAERFFKTQIHLVSESGAGVRYLNTQPASIPPELLAHTFSVTGLSNIVIHRESSDRYVGSAAKAHVGPPLQNEGGMGPLAWAQGYDLPIQHGYTGQGVTVGEIENGLPVQAGSIEMYDFAFDLPKPAKLTSAIIPVDGGCTRTSCSAGGDTSFMLNEDADYLSALAPGITRYLYQIPDESATSLEDGFNKLVADNHVDIATTFTLISEEDPNSESLALTLDHIIRQGNALGITFVVETTIVSNGTQVASLTIPADSPHVLSAGVSDLQVNDRGDYQGEALWQRADEGGAWSLWFQVPSYQRGIKGVQPNGRNAPDVASAQVAEVSTSGPPSINDSVNSLFPYSIESGWSANEWNSPAVFIAFVADLDQMTKARGGLVNTEIYALYKKLHYGPHKAPAFRDIVQWPPGCASTCPYLPGFDDLTGIGSVDGWNLLQAMKGDK